MRILIWIGCFFVTASIQSLFGMKLGGISAAMFFGATFSIAKNFVSRYDNRKNKKSKKYVDATKGVLKGFVWYGATILYVIIGTISISSDPMLLFDFSSWLTIGFLCIGLAIVGCSLINKKVKLSYSQESIEVVRDNDKIFFCRKCGTRLEEDSVFCHKCGTKIKEEQQ